MPPSSHHNHHVESDSANESKEEDASLQESSFKDDDDDDDAVCFANDGTDDAIVLPKPTAAEVHACQFSSWYSTFRNVDIASISFGSNDTDTDSGGTTNHHKKRNKIIRTNVTIESIIIRPLPSDFIEYLLSDGVRLPECATKVSSCMKDDKSDSHDDRNQTCDSSEDDEESSDDEDTPLTKYSFPSLTQQLQFAIAQLGNNCMPKMNWSSPKDATWINCGSLKCCTPGDVYLLLKSSDFIVFDLEKAWEDLCEEKNNNQHEVSIVDNIIADADADADNVSEREKLEHLHIDEPSDVSEKLKLVNNCVKRNTLDANDQIQLQKEYFTKYKFEHELILRKWCNLHPSMEFRCFVYQHELVAISQRHPSKYYPHLQSPPDGSTHPFATNLRTFFYAYVQYKFANGKIHKYVMDVYIDSQERVWIIDFNVWGTRTDGLLYNWKELVHLGMRNDDIKQPNCIRSSEMRVVTKDMKSMTYDPLSSYRGPTDVINLFGDGTSASSFDEFMKQCVRPSEMT